MKKIILILAVLSNTCFAVQIRQIEAGSPSTNNTSVSAAPIEDYMKTKVGTVNLIESNELTINNIIYKKSIDYRSYGKVIKNSYVKFNTNRSNQIIDIWVMK